MARVTVEDCVEKVPNRYELLMVAAQRAKDISSGAAVAVDRDNDKNPVIALREIAEGKVDLIFCLHASEEQEDYAKKNGVTKEEIAAIITHATMYTGWPKGWAVFRLAKDVWAQQESSQSGKESAKEKFQREIFFPIGEANPYGKYFVGQSYLVAVSKEQVPIFNVTFEPKCRNNWHIHHAQKGGGQLLICVGGRGWYQEEGKEARELTAGSIVNIPANVKHWHGAASDSWFSHLAIEVAGENCATEWCEAVSDADYNKLK